MLFYLFQTLAREVCCYDEWPEALYDESPVKTCLDRLDLRVECLPIERMFREPIYITLFGGTPQFRFCPPGFRRSCFRRQGHLRFGAASGLRFGTYTAGNAYDKQHK